MKLSRKLYLALFVLLFIGIAVYGYSLTKNSTYPKQETSIVSGVSQETETFELVPEDREKYYRVYQNPFVLYLRKALNSYLANDSSQDCIFKGAVTELSKEGIISGLDAFSKDYYKSKFIVTTIDDDIDGNGKGIQIIFQDKPDRIFFAWLGNNPSGEVCLLGFNSKEHFDEKAMKEMIDYYRPYLFDKEHAL